jgi:hypothetical protein
LTDRARLGRIGVSCRSWCARPGGRGSWRMDNWTVAAG